MSFSEETTRIFALHLRVVGKGKTKYLHLPSEYAVLKGLQSGDIAEVTIWTTTRPQAKKEREK